MAPLPARMGLLPAGACLGGSGSAAEKRRGGSRVVGSGFLCRPAAAARRGDGSRPWRPPPCMRAVGAGSGDSGVGAVAFFCPCLERL